MRALSLALTAAVLSACASGGLAAPQDRKAPLEAIFGVRASKSGLMVNVSSNGCTKPEDFRAAVTRSRGVTTLRLVRVRPDPCRSFAQGRTDLTFDYGAIGLTRGQAFSLANPLTVWTGPGD